MRRKYFPYLASFVLCLSLLAASSAQAAVGFPALQESGALLNATTDTAGVAGATLRPGGLVAHLIQIALGLIGIVFIILVLYAGYLWGTAQGNEEQVTQARKMLRESIIGVIIVMGAYFVTAFVVMRIGEATFEPLFPF